MNYLERLQAMRNAQPRKRLNPDENKGTYSPRKLYRGAVQQRARTETDPPETAAEGGKMT